MAHRKPRDLYHSALEVRIDGSTYVIEQGPVLPRHDEDRGVVAVGPVGVRWAGRLALFRYEIRIWRGGHIPDVAEAVDSPRRLTTDPSVARRVLEVARGIPTPVWGRDELRTGEMWNSNAVIAWILCTSGIDAQDIHLPQGGRAPGWSAGLVVAARNPSAL